MGVYIYDEANPHPSGFFGVRVVRKVRDDYRQEYFSFIADGRRMDTAQRDVVLEMARALDLSWASEQITRDGYRAGLDPRNVVGIDGVSWRYGFKKPHTSKENTLRAVWQDTRVDGRGRQRRRNFAITKYGLRNAFVLAANCRWLNTRGISCPKKLIDEALQQFIPYYAEVTRLDEQKLIDDVFCDVLAYEDNRDIAEEKRMAVNIRGARC